MTKAEARSTKRKKVVEAIILRQEPVHLVARLFDVPLRTIFDWLARYRSGGWHAFFQSCFNFISGYFAKSQVSPYAP